MTGREQLNQIVEESKEEDEPRGSAVSMQQNNLNENMLGSSLAEIDDGIPVVSQAVQPNAGVAQNNLGEPQIRMQNQEEIQMFDQDDELNQQHPNFDMVLQNAELMMQDDL